MRIYVLPGFLIVLANLFGVLLLYNYSILALNLQIPMSRVRSLPFQLRMFSDRLQTSKEVL